MRLAKARRTELRLPSSRSLAASLTLIAAAGALISALLMVWEGGVKLAGALRTLLACGEEAKSVVGSVMGATNAFLFGVVLLVFAIAFGFVFDLTVTTRERFPEWMRIGKIGELKRTLMRYRGLCRSRLRNRCRRERRSPVVAGAGQADLDRPGRGGRFGE